MDYSELLKQLDAEIERLKRARELLTESAKPAKKDRASVTKRSSRKKKSSRYSRPVLGEGARKSSPTFLTSKKSRWSRLGDEDKGTGDGGYGVTRPGI